MTNTIEMWWPSPDAFEDLMVEDTETGFDLSAPDGSECGDWLAHWNQDEAHHKVFEQQFVHILSQYANQVLEAHGETEAVTDEQSDHRVETEEDSAGQVS